MSQVQAPTFSVLYNGKNITADVNKYLLSLTYKDKTEGESDEFEIEVEDVSALWQNGWYPEKGAKLTATIGRLKCGTFEIDEMELKGPPDTVTIKGMATGIKNSLRTKKSDAHENKTIKQIAEAVAAKNGLTLLGEIPEITIGRATQNKETDLGFLKRISQQYGIIFSVRDEVLTFTSIYTVEKRASSFTLDKSDLTSYSLKDKADGAKKSKSVHGSAKANEKIEAEKAYADYEEEEGYKYPDTASEDEEIDYSKTENKQQAEAKAKAVMHLSASNQFEGTIEFADTGIEHLAVAGNNFQLTGLGVLAGKYHIKASTHKIYRSGGHTVELEIKRLQTPKKTEQITHKKKKSQPSNVNVLKTNRQLVVREDFYSRNIIDY